MAVPYPCHVLRRCGPPIKQHVARGNQRHHEVPSDVLCFFIWPNLAQKSLIVSPLPAGAASATRGLARCGWYRSNKKETEAPLEPLSAQKARRHLAASLDNALMAIRITQGAPGDAPCVHHEFVSNFLLLTRFAHHLHIRNLQMPVFGVVLLHASVFRRVLGIFFKVVRRRV